MPDMKARRIIWVVWCLAWVLIYVVLGIHGVSAWSSCNHINQEANQFIGGFGVNADSVNNCGSVAEPVLWVVPAALSALAILLPVGKQRHRPADTTEGAASGRTGP
jgi:hypothetical protein